MSVTDELTLLHSELEILEHNGTDEMINDKRMEINAVLNRNLPEHLKPKDN